jgi:hypothetical protein
MSSSLDDLVDVLLPLSGSLEARMLQVPVRTALKAELQAMAARPAALPTSLDDLADELLGRLAASPALSAWERIQAELTFAPHRRITLQPAWASMRSRVIAAAPALGVR